MSRSGFWSAFACLAVAVILPAGAAARPTPAPAAAAPATLVAVWHMDEPPGSTVMADAVGGHNGALNAVQTGLPGFVGGAYAFSRSTVTVPSARALSPGRKKLTLTVRLNTTLVPIRPDWDLMRKGVFGDGLGDYKIEFQPSGQASCGFTGTLNTAELVAGPRLNDGRWHTVQCIKTAKEMRLVVDGRRFTKRGRIGSITNGSPLVIGARPGSDYFQGALDEASVVVG